MLNTLYYAVLKCDRVRTSLSIIVIKTRKIPIEKYIITLTLNRIAHLRKALHIHQEKVLLLLLFVTLL
jgi:hypothetical protein